MSTEKKRGPGRPPSPYQIHNRTVTIPFSIHEGFEKLAKKKSFLKRGKKVPVSEIYHEALALYARSQGIIQEGWNDSENE